MKIAQRIFAVASIGIVGLMLYLLITYEDPNPDMKRIILPENNFGGGSWDYFPKFFESLGVFGWTKMVLGVLFGVFLYWIVPRLVDKYGGEGFKCD